MAGIIDFWFAFDTFRHQIIRETYLNKPHENCRFLIKKQYISYLLPYFMQHPHMTYDKARVINFSDAVFSIAMTLLVLEISIPSYNSVVKYGTWEVLSSLVPSFIGFLVSFLVTALYWVTHLRIFKYVSTIDHKLLWISIFMLLFIVLLPFSTAFYVNGVQLTGPFVFYCFNLSSIGLFHFIMISYVVKKEKGSTGLTVLDGKMEKARALNALIVWMLAGLLAFVLPTLSRMVFILIFVFQALLIRYYKKKQLKLEQHEEL